MEDRTDFSADFGTCNAIWKAQNPTLISGRNYRSALHDRFKEVFPHHTDEARFCDEPNAHDVRILALCFMAAISERP